MKILQSEFLKKLFVVFTDLVSLLRVRRFYAAHFYRRHCKGDLVAVWIGDRTHESIYKCLFTVMVVFKMSQFTDNDIGSFQFWKNFICIQLRKAVFKVADAVFTVFRVKGCLFGAVSWIIDDLLSTYCFTERSPRSAGWSSRERSSRADSTGSLRDRRFVRSRAASPTWKRSNM